MTSYPLIKPHTGGQKEEREPRLQGDKHAPARDMTSGRRRSFRSIAPTFSLTSSLALLVSAFCLGARVNVIEEMRGGMRKQAKRQRRGVRDTSMNPAFVTLIPARSLLAHDLLFRSFGASSSGSSRSAPDQERGRQDDKETRKMDHGQEDGGRRRCCSSSSSRPAEPLDRKCSTRTDRKRQRHSSRRYCLVQKERLSCTVHWVQQQCLLPKIHGCIRGDPQENAPDLLLMACFPVLQFSLLLIHFLFGMPVMAEQSICSPLLFEDAVRCEGEATCFQILWPFCCRGLLL